MSNTCYLGGPMRGIPYFNFPAFYAAAELLRSDGWTVHSPAEKDRDHLDVSRCPTGSEAELRAQGFEVNRALTRDFAHILDSQAVVFLPGWEGSTGALWEMAVAYATGKDLWELNGTVSVPTPGGWKTKPSLHAIDPPQVVKNPTRCGLRYGPERIIVDEAPRLDVEDIWPPSLDAPSPLRPHDLLRGQPDATWWGGEVRVTDPDTGGQKGKKACQISALDPVALEQVGLVAGMGVEKYERFNYLRGYAWSLSVDALFRHLTAFLMGEDNDPGSGLPHTAHAAWHAMALTSFLTRSIGKDDRAPKP